MVRMAPSPLIWYHTITESRGFSLEVSTIGVQVRGIQIAQLVLKHRQNKNQKQRIVCFVGSPVSATKKQMETLGKNLKKNNVAIGSKYGVMVCALVNIREVVGSKSCSVLWKYLYVDRYHQFW